MLVSSQAGDELVSERLDASLEVGGLLGLPVGAAAGNSLAAGKSNVEHVLLVMPVVTGEAIVGEAELAQRQRGFAG